MIKVIAARNTNPKYHYTVDVTSHFTTFHSESMDEVLNWRDDDTQDILEYAVISASFEDEALSRFLKAAPTYARHWFILDRTSLIRWVKKNQPALLTTLPADEVNHHLTHDADITSLLTEAFGPLTNYPTANPSYEHDHDDHLDIGENRGYIPYW